ncbi:MAG: hypothetical protein IJ710_00490 [Prevotella sp.]|nr:hypothetical protein [Prevotella sp.]
MKAIKYLVMGALMLGLSAPAMAQNPNEDAIKAATRIINAKPADVDKQLKTLLKDTKTQKNGEVLVGIGRAFLNADDLTNAQKWVDAAFALKKGTENSEAHILQGDIYARQDDGGRASTEYEQAILFDKKNPLPYEKYARVNRVVSPELSEQKLNDLRRELPSYPVDLIIARIYQEASTMSKSHEQANANARKAAQYYAKVDLNNDEVKAADITNYSLVYFDDPFNDFNKSLEISRIGNKRFPTYLQLNRTTLYNLVSLQKYGEAVEYVDRLFNKSDSTNYLINDYIVAGNAYLGNKDHANAIKMFEKAYAFEGASDANKLIALKSLSDCYMAGNDYPNAIAKYNEYLTAKKASGAKMSITDYDGLGIIYRNYAAELKEQGKNNEAVENFKLSAKTYGDMVEAFKGTQQDYAYGIWWRGRIFTNLDPELTEGLAVEDYTQLVNIIEAKSGELSKPDKLRLKDAYTYLGYYNIKKDNMELGKTYLQKLLTVDPTNAQAQQILEQLK